MKRLLCSLLFVWSTAAPAQKTEHVHLEKAGVPLPAIGGVQEGNIPYYQLCSSNGLECSDTLHVVSFRIHYIHRETDVEVAIQGNHIPDSICAQIGYDGIGIPFFITDIFGRSDSGFYYPLWSLSLIPVRDED